MAVSTTNTTNIRNPLAAFGEAVLTWMETYADSRSRQGEIAALSAKTDEELAEMGLQRDRIPHYVFRDLFYV
jgi:uroporphyrinogen-III synthase